MRKLEKKDVQMFKQIRLEALEEVPEAFAASYEEEVDQPHAFFEFKLNEETCFYGIFDYETLVGIVSLTQSKLLKMNHKAAIGSVYVAKEARGKGIGKKLLDHVIKTAHELGIEQLQLVVASKNERAKQLYESLGFHTYGFEERALKVNGEYIDEDYMMKFLRN
ncbi:GNAT family N-acetyltransferase [Halalkalibacter kiskunsagensis]|uniref:GNAT family N-acetyltransferase n=1 Tax=Halalkalibacter kiskunsagensis TaxID=1548599 RepID=A0ABV6K7N1_9BACI